MSDNEPYRTQGGARCSAYECGYTLLKDEHPPRPGIVASFQVIEVQPACDLLTAGVFAVPVDSL